MRRFVLRRGEAHLRAVARHIFLNDNMVGPIRHGGAGKNTHCLTVSQTAVKAVAGRHFADNVELRLALRDILKAQCIAIHGRHMNRRLRALRRHITAQHTTCRLA